MNDTTGNTTCSAGVLQALTGATVRETRSAALCAPKRTTMNLFSLSHLNELAKELPDPRQAAPAEKGYRRVIRLPIHPWDAQRNADHPEREFEAHAAAFVEFEIVNWKDTRGVSSPRWVLRGLVAM
jgi:hypothetical protein